MARAAEEISYALRLFAGIKGKTKLIFEVVPINVQINRPLTVKKSAVRGFSFFCMKRLFFLDEEEVRGCWRIKNSELGGADLES